MARRIDDADARGASSPHPSARAGTVSAYDLARGRRERSGIRSQVGFLVLLGIGAAVVLLALGTVLRPLTRTLVVGFADSNPGALSLPFVADFVREDLGETLTAPASGDTTLVEFTVAAGETASGIAGRLADEGLLRDRRAFLLIAIDRGVTGQLDVGTFLLRRNLTPGQLVGTLLEARDPSFLVQFRTGLRLEQMTAYIQARPDEIATLQMNAADFLALVRNPPKELLADYPWLELPKAATLEGYLAAGAYRVLPDTSPEELVRMMLDRFIENVGPKRIQAAKDAGRSLHEVVTLASLVERETADEAEKALVAGVYQNRIDREAWLNADPTVIWGVDLLALQKLDLPKWAQYSFWNVPKEPLASIEFPEAIAGYQTYRVGGLFPGPIATPTTTSIDAALAPATKTGYLYFVAIPGGGGTHDFSKTYEEHLEKLRKYGYIK
ncbi:MAG: endolytic transglycosylase MltG [Chloroflexota bacterium]